jgi:hypothetical protein
MSRPIRRSQAIAPFGIGALVDFPGPVSLIHAGLDAWPFDEANADHREFRVEDERRLALRLGVDYFVQPPDFRMLKRGERAVHANLNIKLPFLRFPLWHSCPRCGRMYRGRFHDNVAPTCRGPIASGTNKGKDHPPRKTVQVRFVAACRLGHLHDFPWLEWLFRHPDPDWKPEGDRRWIRIRSTGSAALTGFEITAEERDTHGEIKIVGRRTLAGAFQGDPVNSGKSALGQIGVQCKGANPVLAIGENNGPMPGCSHELYPLLRGASNLYFAHVFSSIYIPEIDDRGLSQELLDLLDDHAFKSSLLASAQTSGDGTISGKAAMVALRRFHPATQVDPEALADAANRHILKDLLLSDRGAREFMSQKIKISPDQRLSEKIVADAIHNRFPEWDIDPAVLLPSLSAAFSEVERKVSEGGPSMTESEFRQQEYKVFCRDIQDGYPKTNLLIKSSEIGVYDKTVVDAFERISLLHKLRETRAFAGFSRIFPDGDLTRDQQWALIASKKKNWLPAVIVRGEGVFLKFRKDRLDSWKRQHGRVHESRLSSINRNMEEVRQRRHQESRQVSPQHVLIHTFAHLLINQLVYECGYGSASLRERIYSSDDDLGMCGVLIYTAAGDSEGTMGGLVRMGQPDYLGQVVERALEKARWCSSDPICIESKGQGPDNCNLAACHSCSLLPETSCEEQNRLLDRGVVIGTIERPDIGFFS